jgi:hypothetical protein
MITTRSLLRRIEVHLATGRASASALGRTIAGDPNFIFDLRAGRELRRKTLSRVAQKFGAMEAGIAAAQHPPERAGQGDRR